MKNVVIIQRDPDSRKRYKAFQKGIIIKPPPIDSKIKLAFEDALLETLAKCLATDYHKYKMQGG